MYPPKFIKLLWFHLSTYFYESANLSSASSDLFYVLYFYMQFLSLSFSLFLSLSLSCPALNFTTCTLLQAPIFFTPLTLKRRHEYIANNDSKSSWGNVARISHLNPSVLRWREEWRIVLHSCQYVLRHIAQVVLGFSFHYVASARPSLLQNRLHGSWQSNVDRKIDN